MNTVTSLTTVTSNTQAKVGAELSRTGGLLRLAPAWVPRSFLQPGLRIKLHPDDTYAYGANRGGIDERWFASTTEAANDGRVPDEGLSYCVVGNERFTLRQAEQAARAREFRAHFGLCVGLDDLERCDCVHVVDCVIQI
jgi:hypothetical protein